MKIKTGIDEFFKEQDRLYPNRHKVIHKVSCKNCPSESKFQCQEELDMDNDLKAIPKEIIAKEYAFVCAWRPSKLCKGFCDKMEIDQQFLDTIS